MREKTDKKIVRINNCSEKQDEELEIGRKSASRRRVEPKRKKYSDFNESDAR